jgi:hypothetical protein
MNRRAPNKMIVAPRASDLGSGKEDEAGHPRMADALNSPQTLRHLCWDASCLGLRARQAPCPADR